MTGLEHARKAADLLEWGEKEVNVGKPDVAIAQAMLAIGHVGMAALAYLRYGEVTLRTTRKAGVS
jgi:hypothetical protein